MIHTSKVTRLLAERVTETTAHGGIVRVGIVRNRRLSVAFDWDASMGRGSGRNARTSMHLLMTLGVRGWTVDRYSGVQGSRRVIGDDEAVELVQMVFDEAAILRDALAEGS